MLKVCEVKADGTGHTWDTILAFVWKPQKKPHLPKWSQVCYYFSQISQSHVT